MLGITIAQQLKDAGVEWKPLPRDMFALPDRDMDDHIFVINFMTIGIGMLRGEPVVTFFGATDMPLDYIPLSEAVWLPSEAQLRVILERGLVERNMAGMQLTSTADGYTCQIKQGDEAVSFDGFGVDEVYAQAVLYVLNLS
ncbi:MAG: hypothetical protein AAF629_35805 [Chloroflexota bacterium]